MLPTAAGFDKPFNHCYPEWPKFAIDDSRISLMRLIIKTAALVVLRGLSGAFPSILLALQLSVKLVIFCQKQVETSVGMRSTLAPGESPCFSPQSKSRARDDEYAGTASSGCHLGNSVAVI